MTPPGKGPSFSLREVPFSTFGSWLDLSCVIAEKTVADDVHLVSHQGGFHPVLRLVPVVGRHQAPTIIGATPARLRWAHPTGRIDAAFESPDTLRLSGGGLGLQIPAADPVLTPFSGCYFFRDPFSNAYVFTSYQTGRRYRVTVLAGDDLQVSGDQALAAADRGLVVGADGGTWDLAVEEHDAARAPYRTDRAFPQVADAAETAFAAFLDTVAPWRDQTTPAAALAAYVLWSATTGPAGFLRRPAVLMSKHWMDKVWSWDHCFNALALTGLPELAWDQYRLPFDHQDPAGALPDSVSHSEVLRNFVKPPVHGWALQQLRHRAGDPDRGQLADIYRQLADWTRFWLNARRAPGADLPHYQHGNDSGWDNATTFCPERLVESGDLAALLVLQLRALADLAGDLDRPAESADWSATATRLHTALLDQLWTGDRFRARGVRSGHTWISASLLDLMPIVLGEQLPPRISERLAARISGHLTAHGLATELPTSPSYEADGYWRGPIWAPSTVLIEDGLRRAGHTDLADEISLRFRRLCETSGFAENFDARTGAGLRDQAYTWTASGYLLLAAAHRRRRGSLPRRRGSLSVPQGSSSATATT